MADTSTEPRSPARTEDSVVQVKGLRSGYGSVEVLKGIDFAMTNEIFSILGANGAGKTTLLATLARLLPVMDGSIQMLGHDVTRMPAFESARLGIGYVPQEAAVFPDLTIMENLSVGAMVGSRALDERLEEVFTTFPDLRKKTHLRAGNLSCLLYTSPSPRDATLSRMPSSA